MDVTMFPGRASDSDNPFVSILVDALDGAGVKVHDFAPFLPRADCDSFHIHWPEAIFWGPLAGRIDAVAGLKAGAVIRRAAAARRAGKPVVWTVHNLVPHEQFAPARERMWTDYMSRLLPLVSDVVVMAGSSLEAVVWQYPTVREARAHVVPHPHYMNFFNAYGPHGRTREMFGMPLDVPLLVSVGRLRRYKQVVELVSALSRYPHDFRFLIAGSGEKSYLDEVRAAVGGDARFVLDIRRLTHRDVASYLADADLAVFGFSRILNSGSVLSAISMGTPVVCPHAGALVDLHAMLGPSWVRTYEPTSGERALIDAIATILGEKNRSRLDLSVLSPAVVATSYARIYRGVQ